MSDYDEHKLSGDVTWDREILGESLHCVISGKKKMLQGTLDQGQSRHGGRQGIGSLEVSYSPLNTWDKNGIDPEGGKWRREKIKCAKNELGNSDGCMYLAHRNFI